MVPVFPVFTRTSSRRGTWQNARMARKSSLTPARHAKIVKAVAEGAWPTVAAALAAVPERTFQRWMERGENAAETDPRYALLVADVRKAEAEYEHALTREIDRQGRIALNGSWRALESTRRARFPDRWKEKTAVEVSSGNDAGLPILVQIARAQARSDAVQADADDD